MTKPILQVHHLTKSFGKKNDNFIAVDDLSFNLYRGEILGIIGESGSGKSTIAKLITRLLPADKKSQIILDDENITNINGNQLKAIYKKIQMIFQQPQESFDPRKTLQDSLLEPMINHGMNKMQIKNLLKELLAKVNLDESILRRYPHQVSGGQCQRAGIARAICLNPKILICDEATSALDVTVQKQILELLLHLKQELNLSIIFICHDIALVQKICDRVIVLKQGKIIESGITSQVIRNPQKNYTKNLIDCAIFKKA